MTIHICSKCKDRKEINDELEKVKQQATRPVMTSITIWDKDNFCNFSDTDSSTDYFHSYSLGINHLLDWFTESRAQPSTVLKLQFGNNEDLPKYHKRLERIAKTLRYKIKTVTKKGIYRISENTQMCYIQPYDYKEYYLFDANLISEKEIITQ